MAETKTPSWHWKTAWHKKTGGQYFVMKIAFITETNGTMADYPMTVAFFDIIKGTNLTHVTWDPGGTAPTNGMTMTLLTKTGEADIMQGALAGLSSSTSAHIPVPVRDYRMLEAPTFTVSGNSVNSATFDLYLHFEENN